MLRLLDGGGLQPKLRVGAAGDAYEREADRMADAMMRNRVGGASLLEEDD